MEKHDFILIFLGLIAGLIDSIAGGGGLITLPGLALVLGAGPTAVATNKIVGTVAAVAAFLTYHQQSKKNGKKIFFAGRALHFSIAVGLGALFGSLIGPHLPDGTFKVLMAVTCPLVLYLVFRKDFWLGIAIEKQRQWMASSWIMWLTGIMVGIYDGAWGPGGGTFMLLGLLLFVRLPLLEAVVLGRFVNAISASVGLLSYGVSGWISPREGLVMAIGVAVGASIGPRWVAKNAIQAVRWVLLVVITLLMIKILGEG